MLLKKATGMVMSDSKQSNSIVLFHVIIIQCNHKYYVNWDCHSYIGTNIHAVMLFALAYFNLNDHVRQHRH